MKTAELYFDIETVCSPNKPSLDEIEAPSNYKDADKIQAYKEANVDKLWRKQALDSMKAQVICISYAINDEPVITIMHDNEEDVMKDFESVVGENPYAIFIGHNILRFDIPFLWHRAVKYKLPYLKSILPHERYDKAMVRDTLSIFSVTSYGSDSWISLDTLAKFLGLPTKEHHGSEIHDLYLAKDYDAIAKHCEDDVNLVRTIYKLTQ